VVLGGEKIRVGRQGWKKSLAFLFAFIEGYYSEVQMAHLQSI
jgi:hypothetical protein